MRSTSTLVLVLLALCFLNLCQGAPRSKRTKTRVKEREHCQLTPDPGSCTSKYRRWFYDPTAEECKSFLWTGCNGNENRFRSRGQCERSCQDVTDVASTGGQTKDDESVVKVKPKPATKCRRLPCKGLRCLHGYDHGLDDNGCQTCQCLTLPIATTTEASSVEVCPQVDCPGMFCPKGFRLDDRGCVTCQCQGCPPLDCPPQLKCRDGYVVDEQTGCESCGCTGQHASEWPLPGSMERLPVAEEAFPVSREELPASKKALLAEEKSLSISKEALLGSKEALLGSKEALPASGKAIPIDRELLRASEKIPLVSAEGPRCPDPADCFLQCSEGFAIDVAGCQLCSCQEYVQAAPPGDELMCRPVECEISCEGGYNRDEIGCEICSCATRNENEADRRKKCPKTSCVPECELKTDKTGCQVCSCKDDHNVTGCDVTVLAACSLYCPGGYDRDSRGCEICECRPLADEKSPGGDNEFVTCAPLEEEACAERCEIFIMLVDKNGCETCECVDREPHFTTSAPEVDERLTGNAGPTVKEEEECPAIECPPSCQLVADGRCPRCRCDEPPEVDAPPTAVTCPEFQCHMWCPDGFRVDTDTGCPLCACVEEQQTGSAIVVTADPPIAVPDSKSTSEEETESQEISPTLYTLLVAPITRAADLERSSTTTTGYPAEVMCSGRNCNKMCISGLRRSESEECFVCDCNPEPSPSKRLVDVNVFNARKGTCSLPPYKGPCHATLTRWYFDYQTGACEMFEYGGCRGYANNFRSQVLCMEFCTPEINQERATRQEWFKEVLRF